MTCRTDECCQGRRPCPTPELCTDKPRLTTEQALRADAGGYECAVQIVTTELKPVRKPVDRQAVVLVIACIVAWAAVITLSAWPIR